MHTPGPWEARTGRSAHAAIYQQGTAHNVAVGVHPDDAPVVAVAPELLAIAQELDAIGTRHWFADAGKVEVQDRLRDLARQAQEILRKATR